MSTPDPELDQLILSLASIAAEPIQTIGRTLEQMTGELDRERAAAVQRRQDATSAEDVLQATVAEAYMSGAIRALEAVASAIFVGIARGQKP